MDTFSAFLTGGGLVFCLGLLREWRLTKKSNLDSLRTVKYLIQKYQSHTDEIKKSFMSSKKESLNDLFYHPNVELDFNARLTAEEMEPYLYFIYRTFDLDLISNINININSVTFLAKDKPKIFDSILLARTQYVQMLQFIKERNSDYPDFSRAQLNIQQMTEILKGNSSKFSMETNRLLEQFDKTIEDCKKSCNMIDKELDRCWVKLLLI